MNFKTCFLAALICITGILLIGCQSDSTDSGTDSSQSKEDKVAKAVVKGAAKAAIRRSPIAIIKAVK